MIIGAGLSGMIAAFVFPREEVIEARSRAHMEHQAVLRFRSDIVSDLTGIPFRRVTVHKGIWTDRGWTEPTITACNAYSRKTLGVVADRSIWDISTVDRWIAPADFRERLCEQLGARVQWDTRLEMPPRMGRKELVISTIPMPVLVPLLVIDSPPFSYAPITTVKARLPGVDVFQTVYFTSHTHSLYRASITGDSLICEWAGSAPSRDDLQSAALQVSAAFGMPEILEAIADGRNAEPHVQQFGKIAPISETVRRRIVLDLTREHGIYSLGRFATWRNLLLDDVVHDAHVIKRLVNAPDDYERALGGRADPRSYQHA